MIRILLRELQVEAAVGLLDWELAQTQMLQVSCEVQVDANQAASSDSVTDTLDYGLLREAIQSFCKDNRFYLLETLADKLAKHLFSSFPMAQSLRLCIIKPAIFDDAKGAGVELEIQRQTGHIE